jgi:uncharacterized membrane protein/protein-disulfide isomerase
MLFPILGAAGALLGLIFSSVSTYDFMAHLDRQVHGIHCSFLPGVMDPDVTGSSGCHVTMMSPFSSVLRSEIWGGIPISVPAMSVFAFLLYWVAHLLIRRRQGDVRATGFFVVAATIPVFASLVMGIIAIVALDAACKLCIGMYVASFLVFAGALGMFLRAARESGEGQPPRTSTGGLVAASAVLGVFVLLPTVAYAATAPDFDRYLGSCGSLPKPADPGGVLVDTGQGSTELSVIEVLDPLCPACKGFEERFEASDLETKVNRQVLLFPLDDQCNWMVNDAIHPGACAISEAVLCAGPKAPDVIDWAFAEQEQILQASRKDPTAAADMARDRFPEIASCIGSPKASAKLNRALRWAVKNRLPVLTPQLYVEGVKLCDEDTDLGMDYMLKRLVERAGARGASK